jgi:hypothetical protein
MPDPRPIGVFDSGVGGLTVLREIVRRTPAESPIYLGDNARAPYGVRSDEEVVAFSAQSLDRLVERDVKAIVVACNTSTAVGIGVLRRRYDLPILGVIRPGASAAALATRNRRVGVIATPATIRSHAYFGAIKDENPAIEVYEHATPTLVPLVEAGELSGPIADFVRALPGMAIDPVPSGRLAPVNELAAQVATAEWDGLSDGLRLERMWPIGHDGSRAWPFPKDSWRRLVMAPFAEQRFLERFVKPGRHDILVSRPETLNALGAPGLAGIGRCFVLRDDAFGEADPPDAAEVDAAGGDGEAADASASTPLASTELRGLHAKLFVVDQPYWSHIFTGSANATDAAFNANVEFLVELKGRNTTNCADCLVAAPEGNAIGFGRLLEEYQPSSVPVPLPDDEEAARALEGIAMQIGSLRFTAEIGEPHGDVYPLHLTARGDVRAMQPRKGESLSVGVRPLSRGAGWAVTPTLDSGSFTAGWQVSFDAITAFFAIELVATRGAAETKASFVVRAELVGEPADRLERVLASELKNRSDLVRLLLMLLGGSDPAFADLVDVMTGDPVPGDGMERSVVGSDALLEPLMRTLARDPKRLDEIGRLVAELAKTEEGKTLLPEGWLDVWAAVEAARPQRAAGDA